MTIHGGITTVGEGIEIHGEMDQDFLCPSAGDLVGALAEVGVMIHFGIHIMVADSTHGIAVLIHLDSIHGVAGSIHSTVLLTMATGLEDRSMATAMMATEEGLIMLQLEEEKLREELLQKDREMQEEVRFHRQDEIVT